MKIASLFVAFALHGSLNPAPNYYSWISPEIADYIVNSVINGEYHEYLDFNGDGDLNIADAVGVLRRYYDNIEYGNKLTVDGETVESIILENYNINCTYWEFNSINSVSCKEYSFTVNEIATANIYLEFADGTTDNISIEVNPFEEFVQVTN